MMEEIHLQGSLFGAPQVEPTNDDYYTPKWLFDALGLQFDLDVASPPGGPPHTPCRHYYTMEDDGLAQPWKGLVWMNPPYSKPAPWVKRFLDHGNGIALLPVSRSGWLFDLWQSECLVVTFQLLFDKPGVNKPVGPGGFATALWALGDVAKQAVTTANLGKVR